MRVTKKEMLRAIEATMMADLPRLPLICSRPNLKASLMVNEISLLSEPSPS
ncbi:hypothetical protein KEJ13_05760 [Candidatus Bathyarchaeota archaeon]|nr:hypothetical protein [Candidatus Bathyarchaeota archaeon]